jgi:hypothetical protein
MAISIIIERRSATGVFGGISLAEWQQVIDKDTDLRCRTEPLFAVNPIDGTRVSLPVGEGDAEIFDGEDWLPFLRYEPNRLVINFESGFIDADNPIRRKIAHVSRQLNAVIATDAGDNLLNW